MNSSLPPSIFNDVMGPVMRGPSSSHCAAGLRIGRIARDLAGGELDRVDIEFDTHGSLATTHESQGSDMGLFGGLMGWQADDERLARSGALLREAGINAHIHVHDIGAPHPNTYRLTVRNDHESHTLTALSTGGGMIEIIEIDGFAVSLRGDYFVTLIWLRGSTGRCMELLRSTMDPDVLRVHPGPDGEALLEVGAQTFVPDTVVCQLREAGEILHRGQVHPVLPVLSRRDLTVPFLNPDEMLQSGHHDRPLSDFALQYECARSGMTADAVTTQMAGINHILRGSIREGLAGTDYADRILGCQSQRFEALMTSGRLLDGGMLNRMILYVTALMEVKSSMGVIVAAPTAGSCAACPGACLAAAETLEASDESAARAMLAAGLIGVFTAVRSSFAAEVGGCQAETGAGAAMAAAALVELAGGNTTQSLAAASMAYQNVLGLVCDPIANRVEAPCLGRNVAAAANALSCANMALAGFDPLVPLDQVLDAHREISASMPRELRCTALGGLSITPASKAIENHLCNRCGQP